MLLHYCFWSHITFPLFSLGVLERKLKELQQTVILHLLAGCSAPASCSPKGCMGRLGSQAQRSPGRKSVQSQHKTLHAVVSSILPQQSSSDSSDHPLLQSATTWTGQNNFAETLFFRFCFKVSHVLSSVLCGTVMSVHRNTSRARNPRCQRLYENSFNERRKYGMIKGVWQKTLCTFLDIFCIVQLCSSWVWVLTESSCQLSELLFQVATVV